MISEADIRAMIAELRQMNNRQPDGRGAYLGNGIAGPVRAGDLADLLGEVLTLREHANKILDW